MLFERHERGGVATNDSIFGMDNDGQGGQASGQAVQNNKILASPLLPSAWSGILEKWTGGQAGKEKFF